MERALERRLCLWRARCQLGEEEQTEGDAAAASASASTADAVAPSAAAAWEVDDVRHSSMPLSNDTRTHTLPPHALYPSSPSFSLSLAALHPSREFASAHLEPTLASVVDAAVASSRVSIDTLEWSVHNFEVDEPLGRALMRAVSVSVRDDADEDGGSQVVRFSTPLFQSIQLGSLTLQCRRVIDEQASQIAFHAAQAEQAAVAASIPSSQGAALSSRPVLEEDYQRFTDEIIFIDESSASPTAAPVSPALLPILSPLLHSYGLPLSLSSASLLHALSGFPFLQHLLVDTTSFTPAAPPALWEAESLEHTRQLLQQRLQKLLWPNADDHCLLLSSHMRCIDAMPPVLSTSIDSDVEEESAEADIAAVSGKFARLALDPPRANPRSSSMRSIEHASSTDGAHSSDAAPEPTSATAASSTAASASITSASSSSGPAGLETYSSIPALMTSFLSPHDWVLEFAAEALASKPSHRSGAASTAGSKKHGKGKGRRR
jgi:hypothetical protein